MHNEKIAKGIEVNIRRMHAYELIYHFSQLSRNGSRLPQLGAEATICLNPNLNFSLRRHVRKFPVCRYAKPILVSSLI